MVDPSLVFGTVSWLDARIAYSEVFPRSFCVYCDRQSHSGGVFLLISKELQSVSILVPSDIVDVWALVSLDGSSFVDGAFYASPGCGHNCFTHLQGSIALIPDGLVILAGDLNLLRLTLFKELMCLPDSTDYCEF